MTIRVVLSFPVGPGEEPVEVVEVMPALRVGERITARPPGVDGPPSDYEVTVVHWQLRESPRLEPGALRKRLPFEWVARCSLRRLPSAEEQVSIDEARARDADQAALLRMEAAAREGLSAQFDAAAWWDMSDSLSHEAMKVLDREAAEVSARGFDTRHPRGALMAVAATRRAL